MVDQTATYPALPACAKHRRAAAKAGSIAAMSAADVDAYGQAVLTGILALQRSEAARALPAASAPHCASGTAHTDGAKILAGILSKQAAALQSAARTDRARRTDSDIAKAYEAAMAAKRNAAALQDRLAASKAAHAAAAPIAAPAAAKFTTKRAKVAKPAPDTIAAPAPVAAAAAPVAMTVPEMMAEIAASIHAIAAPVSAAAPEPKPSRDRAAKVASKVRASRTVLPPHKPFAPAVAPMVNRRRFITIQGGPGFIARA